MRLATLIAVLALLVSCSLSTSTDGEFSIAAYNAYALFDSTEDGDEYDGFSKSDGYTSAVYSARIEALAVMLAKYVDADVIILEEVESDIVLNDLLESGLSDRGYLWYGLAGGESTINVGFISRYEPLVCRSHSYDGERAMLELLINTGTESIRIYGVHLRSKLDDDSEAIRYGQLEHLRSLTEDQDDDLIIILGDFNVDPAEGESGMAEYPCSGWKTMPMPVTGDPGSVSGHIRYSAFLDSDLSYEDGTYWYSGEWYFYDNIFLNSQAFDGEGLDFSSQEIITPSVLTDLYGRPLKFDASDGTGYSDHFPVKLVLK